MEWWPALRTVFEWVGISIPRGEDWGLIVQLFLKKSLGCGLHIARQTRLEQLLRALGLSKSVHIRTGYPEIDGLCSIQSTDPKKVLRILAVPEIRMALVELIGTEPALFLAPGTVTVLDDRILYVESPGNPAVHDLRAALEQDERGVFGRLNRLACFIEEAVDKE